MVLFMNLSVSLLNLVSLINMTSYHLRKTEVEYELKIRGLPATGKADELRKRLTQAYTNNVPVDLASVNSLDCESELEECELKFSDLAKLVEDYEGDWKDNEYNRITTRLWHLYTRIERIPIAAATDDDPEQQKVDLLKKTRTVIDSFKKPPEGPPEHNVAQTSLHGVATNQQTETSRLGLSLEVQPLSPPTYNQGNPTPVRQDEELGNSEESKAIRAETAAVPTQRLTFGNSETIINPQSSLPQQRGKSIPVCKWNLKFDGGSKQSVASFLERAEELRRARGVSVEELFESAVDLFAGPALVWYRSTLPRITSWEQLCNEMKIVFRSPDYDFRLQQEIFNRLQGDGESIDMYIAAIEGLYNRLSVNVPETTRLCQIINNLHPHLQDRLALVDIRNLEDLRQMGRRAEGGRLRVTMPRQMPRNTHFLEPDLAYGESHTHRRMMDGKVSSLRPAGSGNSSSVKCWNCSQLGHRYMNCTQERRRFCYGCGAPDIVKVKCLKCNSRSKNA